MILAFQSDEVTSSFLYKYLAKRIKNKQNQAVLTEMAAQEQEHAKVWQGYTGKQLYPHRIKILCYALLSFVFGCTFVLKLLENEEYTGRKKLSSLTDKIPETATIIAQEEAHEQKLIRLLDEEHLDYAGDIVLGLNDALVELTGTIAGLTFVLMNTTLIALVGIITGIAATLSMAASNYLAERANQNPHAFKACAYTGGAYLITVVLLVFPYLIFPRHLYLPALFCMILMVVLIIAFFNYYMSVIRREAFLTNFLEMAGISLSVALISFFIGLISRGLFHFDIK